MPRTSTDFGNLSDPPAGKCGGRLRRTSQYTGFFKESANRPPKEKTGYATTKAGALSGFRVFGDFYASRNRGSLLRENAQQSALCARRRKIPRRPEICPVLPRQENRRVFRRGAGLFVAAAQLPARRQALGSLTPAPPESRPPDASLSSAVGARGKEPK